MLQGRDRLNAALQAFQARDRRLAADHLRALDAEAPALGETWGAVSRLAMTMGEISLALSAARRHVALAPADLPRRLALGALLTQSGQVSAALAEAVELLRAHPDHPSVLHFAGVCRAQLGQGAAAIEALRGALGRLPPGAAAATWLTLADLKRFAPDDPDLVSLKGLAAQVLQPAEARSTLLYALGKALDDSGDVPGAFAAYSEAAALAAGQRPDGSEARSSFVDALTTTATSDFFAGLRGSQAKSDRPIFVMGLPRSGTTLVEQILASHSAVVGGAELNLFRAATMGLPGYGPLEIIANDAAFGQAGPWTAIGQDYLHLLAERFGPDGRVIDKTLNHTRFVGLIRHVLPGARFIWLRRDLGDTAWSIFRTRFAQGMDWSWTLEGIGRYAADEERLHAHWTRQFPDDILSVPYESLVGEPEPWIRRILNHCALPFEPGVLEFHKTDRPVQTASVGQVRRPLYATSVGGWRRYADQMGPLFSAYEAALAR
jgi:Tfp pilus assembly protein PilF